jgi:hypothetical protein
LFCLPVPKKSLRYQTCLQSLSRSLLASISETRQPSSNMEGNPAEHDEAVSQFCAMTGTQASEVSFSLDLYMLRWLNPSACLSRLKNILLLMNGTSKLLSQSSLRSRTKPCRIPLLVGSDN